jgi:hypothetical protein
MLNLSVVTVELNKITLNKIRVFDLTESGICVFVRREQRHRKDCTGLSVTVDKTKVNSLFCCFTELFVTYSLITTGCFKLIRKERIAFPVAIRVQIPERLEVTFL